MSFSDVANRNNSANLDLLRSMAVLMVLVDHIYRHFHHDHLGRVTVADIGIFGVLLFFVHTALVLMQSMERSSLKGLALAKNFYTRRLFRIYPLSILAVLAAVAMHVHADGRGLSFGARPHPLELVSNLLLVQNLTYSDSIIGPLWSLPIEVQMYLILPLLFLWRYRTVSSLFILWAVCGVLGHWPQVVPALGWFTLLLYIPNFLPGVIAFTTRRKPVIPSLFWAPFVVSIGVIYALSPDRRTGAILCLVLGFAIPMFREITFRPLKWVSKWIATYSYGIYLAHSFCIWCALTLYSSWILFALMIVVLPIALYHAIEQPAIRFGTKLANQISGSPSPKRLAAAA